MDKCREEFEKHYLSLPFHTEWSAQICLDACSFDVKQDAYLPKMDWISSNDADECVIYCCMLNTAYLSFKEQQKRIDELQKNNDEVLRAIRSLSESLIREAKFYQDEVHISLFGRQLKRIHDYAKQTLKGGDV